MSKEKRPPEEGKDKDSKGYLELDFSGLKEKTDDVCERLIYGGVNRKFDGSLPKGEYRLGLDPIYGKVGVIGYICAATALILCFLFHADIGVTILMMVMLLLCAALTVIGMYEIRAKCMKENKASFRLLSSQMRKAGEDDVYFYFKKTV